MLQSHERATLLAEQSICGKSGAAYKWIAAFEADRKLAVGWIGALRPSRQLLRSFLRMRNFLNSINGLPHAEERLQGASRSTHDRNAANS